MKPKIAITVESAADVTPSMQEKHGIKILPMSVFVGDKEFLDTVDIDTEKLFSLSKKTNTVPKTSGVCPEEYRKCFQSLCKSGYDIIHISISSKTSSCFQNALFAAREFENVFVLDSLNLSAAVKLLALEAIRLKVENKSAKEIYESLLKIRTQINTSFILSDTQFLYKGGRCSAFENFSASLLSVRPSIEIIGGKLIPSKKYYGNVHSARIKYLNDKVKTLPKQQRDVCFLNHCLLDENEVSQLKNHLLSNCLFKEVIVGETGCCISSHCGKGCVGLIFKEKVSPV